MLRKIILILLVFLLQSCATYKRTYEVSVSYHVVSLKETGSAKNMFNKDSIRYEGLLNFGTSIESGAGIIGDLNNEDVRDVLFSYSHEGLPFKKFYLEKPEPKLPWFKVYEGKNKRGVSGWYVEGILYPKDCEYWRVFENQMFSIGDRHYRIIKYKTGEKYFNERLHYRREKVEEPELSAEQKEELSKSVKLLKGESFAK